MLHMNIESAIKEIRDYWYSIPTLLSVAKPKFTGTIEDLIALDYLHYEGIRFPDNDNLELVGLFWRHVFCNSTNCIMKKNDRYGTWFISNESDTESYALYPIIRVVEAFERSFPQFRKLEYTLEKTLVEYTLENNDIPDKEEDRIMSILSRINLDYGNYSDLMRNHMNSIYKEYGN